MVSLIVHNSEAWGNDSFNWCMLANFEPELYRHHDPFVRQPTIFNCLKSDGEIISVIRTKGIVSCEMKHYSNTGPVF